MNDTVRCVAGPRSAMGGIRWSPKPRARWAERENASAASQGRRLDSVTIGPRRGALSEGAGSLTTDDCELQASVPSRPQQASTAGGIGSSSRFADAPLIDSEGAATRGSGEVMWQGTITRHEQQKSDVDHCQLNGGLGGVGQRLERLGRRGVLWGLSILRWDKCRAT